MAKSKAEKLLEMLNESLDGIGKLNPDKTNKSVKTNAGKKTDTSSASGGAGQSSKDKK